MMRRAAGFTLVELVVSITLAAIVLGFAGMLLIAPLQHYDLQSRRAELADSAGSALPQLRDDLRSALPNSARVRRNGSFVALEFLAAVDWVRYQGSPGAPFTTSGTFRGIPVPFTGTGHLLSVNNQGNGIPGSDAWTLAGSISAAGSTISIVAGVLPGEQRVTVTPAPLFSADSPRRRAYLVAGPVTFLCDEAAGTVSRYTGYSIATAQSARDTHTELLAAGASVRLLSRDITGCQFSAGAGSQTASQLVTVRFTATRAGDTFELADQIALENLP
jgi:MSHA biogenesis protein MshO